VPACRARRRIEVVHVMVVECLTVFFTSRSPRPLRQKSRSSWRRRRRGDVVQNLDGHHLIPMTIESGPTRCSTRAPLESGFLHPTDHSAPVGRSSTSLARPLERHGGG